MPFAEQLPEQDQRFADLREELLLGYGYNTARAYWSDLEHIHDWALERGKDALALTEQDLRQYCALLRRRKYGESTVRRRVTALRALYRTGGLREIPKLTVGITHAPELAEHRPEGEMSVR